VSQCREAGRIDNTLLVLKLGLAPLLLECHSAGDVRRDAVAEIAAGSNQDEGMHLCSHLWVTEQLLQFAMSEVNRLCRLQCRPSQREVRFSSGCSYSFLCFAGMFNLLHIYSFKNYQKYK